MAFGMKWLKPELDKPVYWLHIGVISITVLMMLKYVFQHDMLSFANFIKVGISVVVADTIAHTVLKLD